jgi:hypothetical protein
LKPNVIMASGMNPDEYGKVFSRATQRAILMATDISEYDASQKIWSQTIERLLMDWCGIPEEFIETFMMLKTERLFIIPSLLKMKVFYKKDSGSTETLWHNSFLRLCISAYIYEYDDLVIIFFVGDDDLIEAINLQLNKAHIVQLESLGMKVKIDDSPVPTFCNFLFTEKGRFVDLVNRAAKLQSKQFSTVDDLKAYQESVKEWISNIRTQSDLEYVTEITGYKYGLEPIAVKLLYQHMKTFTEKNPEEFFNRELCWQLIRVVTGPE